MNKILIVGANFNNKGAQSMLFNTIDEIRKFDPYSEIYFASTETYNESNYMFKKIYYSNESREIAINPNRFTVVISRFIKDSIKMVTGHRNNLWLTMDLKNIMPQINLMIDISGFALGDYWTVERQERYLDGIRLAQKYNIPFIIMPQSFGPFNYKADSKFLLKEEAELLKYPDIIFAREKEGYTFLKEIFKLNNVQRSTDLVLQKEQVNANHIFKTPVKISTPHVCNNAVGIVPNNKCFIHGNKELVLNYYKMVIKTLLENGKEIYVFRHSGEDIESCNWICNLFSGCERVHLIENDFSCLEYDDYVKNFQFIICSRYHGIVHAYRNAVPCIILGWAVKYTELAEQVSQSQYIFNVTDGFLDEMTLKGAVSNMLQNYQLEADIIRGKVKEIQKDNCFSYLREYIH